MRIGIDIDDTLCDSFGYLLPYICRYFDLDYDSIKAKDLTYPYFAAHCANYYDFAKKYYEKLIPNAPLRKGALKYLNKIKKRGHEIVFITARNNLEFDRPYQISYDYLVKNEVPFDSLIIDAQDKGKVCLEEEIDVFFDDNIKNYYSVKERNVLVYLFSLKSNKQYKDAKRVKNFRQIYKIIKKEERHGRR